MSVVKEAYEVLRDPKCKPGVKKHRREMLMRFCGARTRKPQRLVTLTLNEERARWDDIAGLRQAAVGSDES